MKRKQEDKNMLLSLWKVISDPKYYELREYSNKLIEFLQRVEKEECLCNNNADNQQSVLVPNGVDWVKPNSNPQYVYSTTITNDEWQKSVRYI